MPIHLRVPKTEAPGPFSFNIQQKSLENWIADLPLAHIGKTSQSLHALLVELNSLDLATTERFRVLDRLHPVLEHIDGHLTKRYFGAFFPLSQKILKIASLAKEFQELMATGYKIIIFDYLTQKDNNLPTATFITVLHRCMFYLSNAFVKTYEIYTPYPPSIWHEIHWLYYLSEVSKIHRKSASFLPVKDCPEDSIPDSVEGLYKQALLVAIAGPGGMHQAEIRKVYNAAGKWQKNCVLWKLGFDRDISDPDAELDTFLIDLNSDSPPVAYRIEDSKNIKDPQYRLLDTSGLGPVLEACIIRCQSVMLSAQSSKTDLTANTLRRLILSWRTTGQRSFARKEIHGKVQGKIVLGLSVAHEVVSSEKFSEQEKVSNLQEIGAYGNYDDKFAVEEHVFLGSGEKKWLPEITDLQEPQEDSKFLSTHEPILIVPQECVILDHSAGGARILWNPKSESKESKIHKSEVGQLIALKIPSLKKGDESTFEKPWHIGMVRWMQCEILGHVEFGIQILAPSGTPIFFRNTRPLERKEPHRGFLLPAFPMFGQPETVIIASLLGSPGDTLLLFDSPQKSREVLLGECMESSLAFVRLRFTVLQTKKEIAVQAPVSKLPKKDEFSDLWGDL
ncbi:cyclic-di-GMP-binding protein [Gammaproteobacteria bacterium]